MSQEPLQEIISPRGLVTTPNKAGWFEPGALRVAQGLLMRDPGVVTVQTALVNVDTGVWSTSATAEYICDAEPYNSWVRFYLNPDVIWRYIWNGGAAAQVLFTLPGWTINQEALYSGTGPGRFAGLTMNGARCVIPFRDSVVAFDSPTSGPRLCGFPAPTANGSLVASTNANAAIANGSHAHYTAVLRRKHSDNVESVSAPSAAYYYNNTGGAAANLAISWRVANALPTDYLDVYRTKTQPNTVNTGADYYLVASTLVGAVSSGRATVSVTDTTSDQNLGESLYTNSGARGAGAGNRMPLPCKAVCTFKGYTFYLGITELPSYKIRIGTAWNIMGTSATGAPVQFRQGGIGEREVVGNFTSGGNQITAVSAGDIVGIKVGQRTFTGYMTGPATVSAVGASTITFTGATFNTTLVGGNVPINDVIEIDGVTPSTIRVGTVDFMMEGISGDPRYRDTVAVECLDRVLPPTASLGGGGSIPSATVPAESLVIFRPYSVNSTTCTGPMTLRATNGANYVPPLPRLEAGDTAISIPPVYRKNMLAWSEQNNADSCPAPNRAPCGSGELYAGVATRDAMWIFASDGLWRLSGTGGSAGQGFDWRLDPVDSTLSLAGPRCACALRDAVYALTSRGLVRVDSSGAVTPISAGRVDELIPPSTWVESSSGWVTGDEINDEIVIGSPTGGVYIYNTRTDAFTELTRLRTYRHGAYLQGNDLVYFVGDTGTDRYFKAVLVGGSNVSSATTQLQYQPAFDGDPFALHQWQTVDLVFDPPASPQNVTPWFNGVAASTQTRALQDQGQSFARAGFGVPRNAPAVSNCLSVGWSINAGEQILRFFGAALRKSTFTSQRSKR